MTEPLAPASPAAASTTADTVAAIAFRPFTDHDWGAFAGAEPFADGSDPVAAEGTFTLAAKRSWIVILDATGGCLLVEGDPQTDHGGYVLDRPFATPADAEAWFRDQVGTPAHLLDFLMAGFVRA